MWGIQEEIRMMKMVQFEQGERLNQQGERLNRLERRHDDRDTRIRSLWSTPSPFPAPLSTFGTQQPNSSADHQAAFGTFDDQQNIISGLHLEDVDVPRRGASRANSVRFDDSATTNHWIHDSPGPSDYFGHRSSNSVGGYPIERSSSHKSDQRSDGRQSSMRSFDGEVSFEPENGNSRPPTRGSDMLDSCLHRPSAPPIIPAPAIIRCVLSTASAFNPLVYAVVCTGSARSSIESSLVTRLGLQDRVEHNPERGTRVQLTLLFGEAIVIHNGRQTAPTRPARLTVEFSVLTQRAGKCREDGIGIFIGSDIMAAHMGDVLFSQNRLVLHVDDGRKVYIPFIRPEAEDTFSDIMTIHADNGDGVEEPKSISAEWSPPTTGLAAVISRIDGQPHPPQSHPPVSSPRPVNLGRQASVIRDVSSSLTSPEFSSKNTSAPTSRPTSTAQTEPNRWPAAIDRTTSFGSDASNRNPPASQEPTASGEENSSHKAAEKPDSDNVTRGRSLTNPYPSSGGFSFRPGPNSVWDNARKGSITSPLPSTPTTAGAAGARGSQNRSATRMKVLRTSKSFSSSTDKAPNPTTATTAQVTNGGGGNGGNSGGEGFGPVGSGAKLVTRSVGRTHSRAVSGDLGQKQGLAKGKGSNVVGGATAFHWMAPKTSVGEER
ncbi:hypothetical protein EX30DRAFT_375287 [Ascodesmis nigricans]|uniref:Ubiquitin carboxyl-terminal hydrolase 19 n=1 Tax=Ascodesmis nigricans TaxID=341454 RepID=A0A4S2MIG1_9PEZI|nr:hypothetical protein EX30DRAFT_375287 [Ascodesmis nigricans]